MFKKTIKFEGYREGYVHEVFDVKIIRYYMFGILIYTKEIRRK